MIILSIRTDKPLAEVELYKDYQRLKASYWMAHRQLAETIHQQLKNLLASQQLDWESLEGIVCYKGPGSFTGLRIGLSVGNALAYGLAIPITGTTGKQWIEHGIHNLQAGKGQSLVTPEYGSPPHTT